MAKNQTPAIAALTFAEVTALTQSARVERFAVEALSSQRAFSSMGKLFTAIESALPKGKGIFPLLIAAGIKKGTVSNASYASKVFALVDNGKLTEAEYDSLTFGDCLAIVRVTGPAAKKRLTQDEAVASIREHADFAEDFDSLAETGLTATAKAAADKATAKAKKVVEEAAAASAKSEKAELEELRKRNEELKAAAAKASGDAPAAEAPAEETADEDETVHDAPEPDKAKPKVEATTTAEPVKITSKMVIDLLDEVELAMMELSAEEQAVVGTRLVEMADAFVASGASVTKPEAKPAKKGKAVAAK